MALSNWDTLAVAFEIEERVWDESRDGPLPTRAQNLALELDRFRDQIKDENPGLDLSQLVHKMCDDPRWEKLVSEEIESRVIRSVRLLPSSGTWTDPESDYTVETYKNWIYVSSPSRHSDQDSFTSNVIMQVEEGIMQIGKVSLQAWRGPQEGVFLVATKTTYDSQVKGAKKIEGMAACGVYGYDNHDFVGVTQETREWFQDKLADLGATLAKVDLSQAERFNQGDQYFADQLGFDAPRTDVGQADQTLMSQMLDDQ